MYKNENMLFCQKAMKVRALQQQNFQAYLREYPEHTVLFSQWLVSKGYISQEQMQNISRYSQTNDQPTKALPQMAKPSKEPESIGRYKIISVLGKGGMGKVYKVYDSVEQKLEPFVGRLFK